MEPADFLRLVEGKSWRALDLEWQGWLLAKELNRFWHSDRNGKIVLTNAGRAFVAANPPRPAVPFDDWLGRMFARHWELMKDLMAQGMDLEAARWEAYKRIERLRVTDELVPLGMDRETASRVADEWIEKTRVMRELIAQGRDLEAQAASREANEWLEKLRAEANAAAKAKR